MRHLGPAPGASLARRQRLDVMACVKTLAAIVRIRLGAQLSAADIGVEGLRFDAEPFQGVGSGNPERIGHILIILIKIDD